MVFQPILEIFLKVLDLEEEDSSIMEMSMTVILKGVCIMDKEDTTIPTQVMSTKDNSTITTPKERVSWFGQIAQDTKELSNKGEWREAVLCSKQMVIDMSEASKMTNSTELEFGIVQLIKPKDKENGSVARESDGLENQNPTMCQDTETSNHWHKQI